MLTVIVHLPSCTLSCRMTGLGGWGQRVVTATHENHRPGINYWQHWTYHPNLMLVWMKGPWIKYPVLQLKSFLSYSCEWKCTAEPELDMLLNMNVFLWGPKKQKPEFVVEGLFPSLGSRWRSLMWNQNGTKTPKVWLWRTTVFSLPPSFMWTSKYRWSIAAAVYFFYWR